MKDIIKKANAYDVIIEKEVDIYEIKDCIKAERQGKLRSGRLAYNSGKWDEHKLTQKEYEKLKEVLL